MGDGDKGGGANRSGGGGTVVVGDGNVFDA